MPTLRLLIGALALTALLAARSAPETAEAYAFCAAASVMGAEAPLHAAHPEARP